MAGCLSRQHKPAVIDVWWLHSSEWLLTGYLEPTDKVEMLHPVSQSALAEFERREAAGLPFPWLLLEGGVYADNRWLQHL